MKLLAFLLTLCVAVSCMADTSVSAPLVARNPASEAPIGFGHVRAAKQASTAPNTLNLAPGTVWSVGGFVTIERRPRFGADVASSLGMLLNVGGIQGLNVDVRGVAGSLSGQNAVFGYAGGLDFAPKWAPKFSAWAGVGEMFATTGKPIWTVSGSIRLVL